MNPEKKDAPPVVGAARGEVKNKLNLTCFLLRALGTVKCFVHALFRAVMAYV